MTVSSQISKITYTGNGSTTVWTFTFPAINAASILVFVTSTAGVVTQVPAAQYSVALNAPIAPNPTGAGGAVTFPLAGPPLSAGTFITIVRDLPEIQSTSIANQSIIYPPVVEQEFDYLTLVDQQLSEVIARAVKVNVADQPMAPLPPLAFRQNQQAVFDNAGNLTAGGAVIGTIISPAMVPVVTAPTLPLARTAMGVPPIDSPIFTGNAQSTNPPFNDNDASIATTSFVQNQLSGVGISFPSGTLMLFVQTTAPVGWTKNVAHDNKALRVTSGTVTAGGVLPFTTVFSRTATDPHTLTPDQMPIHTHVVSDPSHTHPVFDPSHAHTYNDQTDQAIYGSGTLVAGVILGGLTGGAFTGITIGGAFTGISLFNAGSSFSHSHNADMRVLYVDVIIAQKN